MLKSHNKGLCGSPVSHNPNEDVSLQKSVGFFLLIGLFIVYVIEASVFMAGGSLSRWMLPLAMIADIFLCYTLMGFGRKTMWCILISFFIMLSAIILSCFTMDYSWDGNFYHQETVARLLGGWNPYVYTDSSGEFSLWTLHYAKCIELIGASIAMASGYIEAAKAVNIIIITSTAFFVYDFICKQSWTGSKTETLFLTVFIICNPIGICQCFTFYIDYTKYYYIILAVVSAISLVRSNHYMDYMVFAAVIILAIGTKFNIFFEEGIVIVAILLWVAVTRDRKAFCRLFLCASFSGIIGVILSYHPYVTNVISNGNPFYPLLGDNTVDIMTSNTPEIYDGNNRITNFLISLFSSEVPSTDRRIGGFGVLMPVMLILSLAVQLYYRRRIPPVLLYASGWVTMSCFFFEQSWWARYICQLWLIPVIGLIVIMYIKSKVNCYLKWGMLGCGLATTLLSFCGVLYSLYTKGCYRECIFSLTEGSPVRVANASPQVIRHFNEHGTIVIPAEVENLDRKCSIYYYGDDDPSVYPIVELTPEQLESLYEKGIKYHLNIDKQRLRP